MRLVAKTTNNSFLSLLLDQGNSLYFTPLFTGLADRVWTKHECNYIKTKQLSVDWSNELH